MTTLSSVIHISKNAKTVILACGSLLVGIATALIFQELKNSQRLEVAVSPYKDVSLPSGKPPVTQETINQAMGLFDIKTPTLVDAPLLDMDLKDRGLTTGEVSFGARKKVTIGPAAFVSWSILGSTLAHEIEIHGNQSFSKIVFKNRFAEIFLSARDFASQWLPLQKQEVKNMQPGTLEAEQQAYLYEIQNSARFKLSNDEVKAIWGIVEQHFPLEKSPVFFMASK